MTNLSEQTRQAIDELTCTMEEEEERHMALAGSPEHHQESFDHNGHDEEEHDAHNEEGMTHFMSIPRETLPCPMELRATVGPAVQLATKPQTSRAASTVLSIYIPLATLSVIISAIPLLT